MTVSTAGDVRIVAVPSAHPYVARVTAEPGITVLPDPPVAGAPAGQWWPPVALSERWIDQNAHRADLLHVHFGTESLGIAQLSAALAAARRATWPVVFTLHDIEHPQLGDQARYLAQLDLIVPAADAVITLTPGAARFARERWGTEAVVIPHPRLANERLPVSGASGSLARVPHPSAPVRLGILLKDVRANVDAAGTVGTALEAVERLVAADVDARLSVWLHRHARNDQAAHRLRQLVGRSRLATRVELIEHDRYDDAALADTLARLDVCILPYGHGTHSGWLELCWDLGVAVAAPAVGYFGEQHDDGSVATFEPGDAAQLAGAVTSLIDPANPSTARADTRERQLLRTQRSAMRDLADADIARRHAELYRALVSHRGVISDRGLVSHRGILSHRDLVLDAVHG